MTKEQKFFNALKDIFIGAKVEGESGYINLMRIKSRYYEKGVFPKLHEDIEKALNPFPHFREELFDKLYSFFSRYFSESGSIYFRYTPLHQNVYEKVYTDDKDVMLFWKTHMLYYVKTDRLFKNLEVELEGHKFFFDVSTLEHKKANEKREIIYSLKDKQKNGTIAFSVSYSEKGKKVKIYDIFKALKKQGVKLTEELLERAFRVFERQSEVDYFINKNAKAFLEEQFNLWLYQYVFSGESEWTETRIKQLQTLKDIALKIIAFISQFEDELVKIWNKPKFVLNSNYVITMDKIADKNIDLIEKLLKHPNSKEQIKEWQQLGIASESFKKSDILKKDLTRTHISKEYRYLPIDTKYFKYLEIEIMGLFDNLDEEIDGWVVKSENYQTLNTILKKFQGRIKCIYIDPPYNTGSDGFAYKDRFKESCWITMMENRLVLAKDLLEEDGLFFSSIDENEISSLSLLASDIFGERIGTIIVRNNPKGRAQDRYLSTSHEYLIAWAKNQTSLAGLPKTEEQLQEYDEEDNRGKFRALELRNTHRQFNRETRPNLWFPLYVEPKSGSVSTEKTKESVEVYPIWDSGLDGCWTWGKPKIAKNIDFLLGRKTTAGRWKIYRKDYATINGTVATFTPKTIWDEGEYRTDHAQKVLDDIMGERVFQSPKAPALIQRLYELSSGSNEIILDYFSGTGTTAQSMLDLNREDGGNRKYLLVEMADYFDTIILPRIKKLIFCKKWAAGKSAGGEGCRHFLKYCHLEQYEDTLRRVKYDDADLFDDPNKDPYNQYIFLRDLKILEALDVDLKENKVTVDLSKLYDGIDIAETLSNLTGKWIKKITKDRVEFADGEAVDLKNLDYKLIKPLIWW
jgi:adenine-specific DNA-methyltransferase